MYLILSGSISMYKDYRQPDESRVAVLGTGDFFGEMALFLGKIPTVSALASSEAVLLIINQENLLYFFTREPQAMFALAKTLCIRLDYLGDSGAGIYLAAEESESAEAENAAAPLEPAEQQENLAAAPAVEAPEPEASDPLPDPEPPAAEIPPLAALVTSAPTLFPEGHKLGQYHLALTPDPKYVYEKSVICPICEHSFKSYAVRRSRMIAERTERDLRVIYKGVEPLYYDVITCPKCWYSALSESFKNAASIHRATINETMLPYKAEMGLNFGLQQDEIALFAGYYLALLCLPVCFAGQYILNGKLWMKLSRLYADGQDEEMQRYAAKKALTAYQAAYEKSRVPAKSVQQLCYIIGELSYMFDDPLTARRYFFLAKTDKNGNQFVGNLAEDRLEDIKAEEKQKREAEE